jgi:hypothetical protein
LYDPCDAAAVAAEAPGIARAGEEKAGLGAAGGGCVLRFFPTTRGNWGASEAGEPGDEEDVDADDTDAREMAAAAAVAMLRGMSVALVGTWAVVLGGRVAE